ncbi:hypothetical protein HMPREF0063_12003 [Aeromicrobium marinum DSM 15272]|uniref:DUF421 domain-containing protein n=1 Tax=Aeromicrobium marinum DSM 15272 TaxID=585531 RepID=E2SE67_9ACTN|nr:YetF domain-containing protein [Aeromicrobium marinum]EFQ82794.1 hypothetical protein HMPREF0063_12003 [Aeromicrobium marinum DSM 15272]
MWFDAWSQIVRVLLVGTATYASLLVLLRISGKRTLAKLNAFDLVATVALGSTLATVLLTSDVAWAEGVVALALLIGLQFVVAALSAWLPGGHHVLTSPPTVLLRDGRLDEAAARRARIAPAEIRQAVRSSGQGDLTAVAAVVLETDGSMSVVPRSAAGDLSALDDVPGRRTDPV